MAIAFRWCKVCKASHKLVNGCPKLAVFSVLHGMFVAVEEAEEAATRLKNRQREFQF